MDDNRLSRPWYVRVRNFFTPAHKRRVPLSVVPRNGRQEKTVNPDLRVGSAVADKRMKVAANRDDSQDNALNMTTDYPLNAPFKHTWN